MHNYYKSVAENFAARIDKAWESEETLEALLKAHFPRLPFDRTFHWNTILLMEAGNAWAEAGPGVHTHPTSRDIDGILQELHPLLDYNIYTQILMNLQSYVGFAYQIRDAEKELKILQDKWESKNSKLNPFELKAKMIKEASTNEEAEYNADLSATKALKIISGFGLGASFRVSPKGSTPAFADSKNISMIGLGGDRFVKTLPTLKIYYITWQHTPNILDLQTDGSFTTPGISYPFRSKSGGEILNGVLFSRRIAYAVYGLIDTVNKPLTVIPRLNSVMIVTTHAPELEKFVSDLVIGNGMMLIRLYEGARPQNAFLDQ